MSKFNTISIIQILLGLLVVSAGSIVMVSFSLFVPEFLEAYQTDVGTVSLAATLVLLVVGLASPIVGRQLDSRSVRSVMSVGGVLMTLGFIGTSFTQNATQMLICYTVFGLGVAAWAPMVAVKHMTIWFPDRLGLATGLACLPVASVVVPGITGWLIGDMGWRQTMQVFAGVAVVTTVLFTIGLRASPQSAAPDNSEAAAQGASDAPAPELLPSGQVYKALLASPMFWFVVMVFFVFLAAPMSMLTHFVLLAENKGFSKDQAVELLTIMGIAALVAAPLSGVLSDKLGPKLGYGIMGILQGGALALLLVDNNYMVLFASSVVLGLFMAAGYIFFASLSAQVIGGANFGTGFGLATMIAAVLGAFPPTIAGVMYDKTGSYDSYFLVLAIMTLLAGVLAFVLKNPAEVDYGQ